MINKQILLPVLIQILLTFILLFRMGYLRISSLKKGTVKIKDIALGQNAWHEEAIKASNSYHNQFQVPLLFYTACIVAMIAQLNSILFVVLCWIFVVSRVFHAYIHSGSNHVPRRFQFFVLGVFSTISMWIVIALNLLA